MVPVSVALHSASAGEEDGGPDIDLGVGKVVRSAVVFGDEVRAGGRGRGGDAVGVHARLDWRMKWGPIGL